MSIHKLLREVEESKKIYVNESRLNAPPANAMSAHDWPSFDEFRNRCKKSVPEDEQWAGITETEYNYAKVRIDACAGIANELLEAGAAQQDKG
jgi:hypothetical protein